MESERWQQLVLQSGRRSRLAREGSYTSFNSVATIQIVPRSRSGRSSCLLCTQLLFLLFVCAHLFSPNTAKILFQPEVSIRIWQDVFMARFVWPAENILPGASSERELCWLQNSVFMLPQGHLLSHLSKALFVFGEGDAGL